MLVRRGDGHVQRGAPGGEFAAAEVALSDDGFETLSAIGEQNA